MAFADNLRKIREGLNLNKVQAATKMGMASQQYDKLEQEGSNPTIHTLERVAKAFGVSVKRLVE